MSKAVSVGESFLPSHYQEPLKLYAQALDDLEFPRDRSVTFVDVMSDAVSLMVKAALNNARLFQRETKKAVKDPATPDELETNLQIIGMRSLSADLTARLVVRLVSGATGTVTGDPQYKSRGLEMGSTVINRRAQSNAMQILESHSWVYNPYFDEDQSPYERAMAVSDKLRRAPFRTNISDQDWDLYQNLITRVVDAPQPNPLDHLPPEYHIKPSKFKIVNLKRAYGMAIKLDATHGNPETPAEIIEFLEAMVPVLLTQIPIKFEMLPSEIAKAMGAATQMNRYMEGVAHFDPSLKQDPSNQIC